MMSTLRAVREACVPGKLRHIIVDNQYRPCADWAEFTVLRASSQLATEWVAGQMSLYSFAVEGGVLSQRPVQAQRNFQGPSVEALKAVPG